MNWKDIYDDFLVVENYAEVEQNFEKENFIKIYGHRSWELVRMIAMRESCDFSVPKRCFVPIAFAKAINANYNPQDKKYAYDGETDFREPNPVRLAEVRELIEPHISFLVKFFDKFYEGRKIFRGGSGIEGFHKKLSFAGAAKSQIQVREESTEEAVRRCIPWVIASTSSEWAKYYFNIHGIIDGYNVGMNVMELVGNPFIHGTAYVYKDQVRMKFFLVPQVGTQYSGGYDSIFPIDEEVIDCLPNELRYMEPVFASTINSLTRLYHNYSSSKPQPLDVEFLIDGNLEEFQKFFVQDRLLSGAHVENYNKRTINTTITSSEEVICNVGEEHLFHTVIKAGKYLVHDLRFKYTPNSSEMLYIIEYKEGKGLFEFLTALPKSAKNVGLLILHKEDRMHDHQQYAVFEDPRLTFVTHTTAEAVRLLEHGMSITIRSNGQSVFFTKKTKSKFQITPIDSLEGYSDENVSAVFLIAVKNGNTILATLNERGWDIIGGFLEDSDTSLLKALFREAHEETGAKLFKNALQPFAYVRSGTYAKGMLFFFTDRYTLLDDFKIQADVRARAEFALEDFIKTHYFSNGKREALFLELMALLTKKNLIADYEAGG